MRARPLLIACLALGCGARVSTSESTAVDTGVDVPDTSVIDEPVPPDPTDGGPAPVDTRVDPPPDTTPPPGCPTKPACSDGVDNDGDGLVDGVDPECTSPYDQDESSFATGIPTEFDPCKFDCFFDGNLGSGDDGCTWSGECRKDSTEPRCPYSATSAADPKICPPPSEKCRAYCGARTPNGCDCTGCCDVPLPSGAVATVRIVSTCSVKELGDPTKCPRCEKITTCARDCGRCDYCLGKWTVPSDCPAVACPEGAERCDPKSPCPCGKYCVSGCCVPGAL